MPADDVPNDFSRNQVGLSTWRQPADDLHFEEPERWYKGEYCNRYPTERSITVEDILRGWKPSRKLISADTKVVALGSCFAEFFVKFLTEHGYNRWQLPSEPHSHSDENLLVAMPSIFENVFVLLQQFRWAFKEFTPGAKLWFGKDRRHFEATEERREKVRRALEGGEIFVITLGLSEIWFDQIENEPMWRTIPLQFYEPERHLCRPASVGETVAAFRELDALIDRYIPGKQFIITLS